MPVAAKLSRKLYETFGDEAAEAMVDWMQSVDRNRAELRETNDLAFARLDARFGEFEARFQQRTDELRHDADMQFAGLRQEMHSGFSAAHEEMHVGFARIETRLEQRFADVLKWSFTFWIGSTVTLVGVLVALARWGSP
ncbi:MAG TPA: hypothetical protein VMV51_06185 [Gemmatimonadaceae bacterium]|nr:hypothetical protein [Gemmatimonadaceae bacterium]